MKDCVHINISAIYKYNKNPGSNHLIFKYNFYDIKITTLVYGSNH